jgi:hypothetical protein
LRKTVMSASVPNNCFNCGNVAMRFCAETGAAHQRKRQSGA